MMEVYLDLSKIEPEELARAAIMASLLGRAVGFRRRTPSERLMWALSRTLLSEFRARLLFGVPSKSASVKVPELTVAERKAVLGEVQGLERKAAETGTTVRTIFETLADALASPLEAC